MGIEIDRINFEQADYRQFSDRLQENLAVLGQLVEDPEFGRGPGSLGAELEMYIVDDAGRPLHANHEILARAQDPQLTLELNRYNLEFNLSPYAVSGEPFVNTEREICAKLDSLRSVAAELGGRVVPIGILPTLQQADFGAHCITDRRRYHALVAQLLQRRGGQFRIDINGDDPLKLAMSDITLEGANTSFQVHYRVSPEVYADTYNAIQLMTPLALALGANSPTLFGHRLWHETRVPLFKQSIDTRQVDRYGWNEPPRVSFGQGWARRGAGELFNEVVRIYPPLLPICSGQSPAQEIANGLTPSLSELRLHQSTVWLWNRPIYDDADGGMLRIEMRALPAGPTAVDMVANAALLIGLAEGVRPRINELLPAIPFAIAEYNFYRAAQYGLDARLVWPGFDQSGYREQSACSIIKTLLPLAREGLERVGISSAESVHYLDVIEQRLACRQTGSSWQLGRLEQLQKSLSTTPALHALLEEFIAHSEANMPVAEWPL